ncbi:MAG: hypothetical protein RL681_280 [Candidatus Parcubacteria bacterium]|jgi:ADP-ribose pyrophosphatase
MTKPRAATTRKIPEHARRVFRGKFFSVYQWRQKLFDGSTTIFERVSRPDATIVVPVTREGRILVLRQKQPTTPWFTCLPGGMIDKKESVRRSAERELLEETGYRPGRMTYWFTIAPSFRVTSSVHVFIARNCVRVARPHLDAGERIVMRAVSFEEFLRVAERPDFRHAAITIETLRARLNARAMRALRTKLLGEAA